jgi:hypothetical protein
LATLDDSRLAAFADQTADYLRRVERHCKVSIRQIAIDAPSEPRSVSESRRLAEKALDRKDISCFTTPNEAGFATIREKVRAHVIAGGAESRLPHANQLWMLVGF